MKPLRLVALCALGVCLLGLSASTASGKGKTLALYEEGRPVPDGAKLHVEVKGFCGSGWTPERWVFPAQLIATHTNPLVVSIEPPGTASCKFEGPHVVSNQAELKEIQLKANHKASVVGIFRSFLAWPEPEFSNCEYEFQNAKGHLGLPGAASFAAVTVGKEVVTCPPGQRKQRREITVVVRSSSERTLEVA